MINLFYIPENLWGNIYPTGSSYICDPPSKNTDIDYIIYTPNISKLVEYIQKEGFYRSSEGYPLSEDGFVSYKRDRDHFNLILVSSYSFYLRWVKATKLAKKLNLREKKDRIILFQSVLYDILGTGEEFDHFGRYKKS